MTRRAVPPRTVRTPEAQAAAGPGLQSRVRLPARVLLAGCSETRTSLRRSRWPHIHVTVAVGPHLTPLHVDDSDAEECI